MIANLVQFNTTGSLFTNRRIEKKKFKLDINWFYDGLSFDNDYVPLYSLLINKTIYNKKVIHYGIPWGNSDEVNNHSPLKGYRKFYYALQTRTFPTLFITAGRTPVNVYVMKGLIFSFINDKIHILFLMTLKSDYILQAGQDKRDNKIDYSKYAIFVSTNFATNPIYKTLYRKIYNEVIVEHLSLNVSTIITNDIAERCFHNNLKFPIFNTLEELNGYLNAFNTKLINEE